jgi:putative ABC transport system permease protein
MFQLAQGRLGQRDFETVIGSAAARQTGLKLGDTFAGMHGLAVVAGSEEHKQFPYKVVGILQPTGSSIDRAIYTSLESVWRIHQAENAVHHKADAEQQVTAVLVQLKSVGMRLWMSEEIKNRTESMAAVPVNEMLRLYQQVLGPMQRALFAMAWLVVIVSSLTILTTLVQAAERRRRETAVMRALGAHPGEIVALIILEAIGMSLCGIAVGWLLGHGAVACGSVLFRASTGMSISAWTVDRLELEALGTVALIGAIAGLLPAWLMYRRSPVRDLATT